jgi:putative modified peptide
MAFQLPSSVVNSLLDRLGSDDEFRSEFCADPRNALASLGFEPASDLSVTQGIWACMKIEQLASKEAIRAGRDAFAQQLSMRAVFSPFNLDVQQARNVA